LKQTRRLRRPLARVVALTLLLGAGCEQATDAPSPSAAPAVDGERRTLSGAGATFPAPIYKEWFERFPGTADGAGIQVRYDAVGSGKGIAAFTERRVDFGATDVPLSPAELAQAEAAGGSVIHIPTVLGAITVVYNLPGSPRLRMDATLIADLFLGRVSTWKDPRITALNPTVRLPGLPVSVVHRSDSSGTTANFTGFLASRVPEFDKRVGQGMAVASAGDFALSLLYTTGKRAYPISSYTYLLVFARQDDPEKGSSLASLLRYMAGPGQASASRLHYTAVPRDLRQSVAAKIRLLHDPDGRLLSS
jgi:ABC-type phosphate transport system substrate-binding protein